MTPGLGNRFAMWRALRHRPAQGFVSQPEPRSIGLYGRGKQLVAGNFLFAGQLIEARGRSIWDMDEANHEFTVEVQGFAWLDDLAAVGDSVARSRAQDWTWDWISRFGKGQGLGWTPDLAGRRIIRWINHALMLLQGRDRPQSEAYYQSLTAQVVFLSRHWREAAPGLPRFEALTGLISAGLALIGMEARVEPALAALTVECGREIDAEGGIPTRNPEELLEVLTLLTWAERALVEAGRSAPAALQAAIQRIAPTLRVLRHADGGLARFHGGGRGLEGRLDQALAAAGVRGVRHPRRSDFDSHCQHSGVQSADSLFTLWQEQIKFFFRSSVPFFDENDEKFGENRTAFSAGTISAAFRDDSVYPDRVGPGDSRLCRP